MKLHVLSLCAALCMSVCAQESFASIETVSFTRVTPANSVENVASQFSVDLMDEATAEATFTSPQINIGTGNVLFVFRNTGSVASAISEVYFDDGTLLAQAAIHNSLVGSTAFTGPGAAPPNLPGGANVSPAFNATAAFSADAQGNPSLGGNPGDVFGIEFSLQSGLDFDDVVDALQDGSLRLGMHVRAIGSGDTSDSFYSNPPDPNSQEFVPEMSSALVWMILATVGAYSARKRLR